MGEGSVSFGHFMSVFSLFKSCAFFFGTEKYFFRKLFRHRSALSGLGGGKQPITATKRIFSSVVVKLNILDP
jgi:hypothetical protein